MTSWVAGAGRERSRVIRLSSCETVMVSSDCQSAMNEAAGQPRLPVRAWSAVSLERSGERRGGRRLKRAPSPGAQIFLFGRHGNLQDAGERFPGKSRSGTSKVPNLALAAR